MVEGIPIHTRKRGIKRLQEIYLATGDEGALVQMYDELVILGARIVEASGEENDHDDVYVLASSVIARLIEKKQPIIRSAVSAYVKLALFYMRKPPRWVSIETIAPDDYSSTDEYGLELLDLIQDCLSYIRPRCSKAILTYVEDTITGLRPMKEVKASLPTDLRQTYDIAMKEVYRYVRAKDMQV